MTRPLLSLLIILFAMAGCSKQEERSGFAPAAAAGAPQDAARRYLAYQHHINIDAEQSKIAAVFEAGQAACREASGDLCTVLESKIDTGRFASASLKFRAKPGGIKKLVAALGRQAEITDQSTTAEDLAGPLEDAAKKQAMLNDYRSKLEALLSRANSDVDALIKVNRELAQVQSELEAITGKHAHLVQRVETEILTVAIHSVRRQSFWRPIALALSDFGANLAQGVSAAVTGVAYMIPWAVLLGVLAWVVRRLRRRWKRPPANA